MMKPVLIKVRQAWGKESRKFTKTYDLFADRSISVETYQRMIWFYVQAPGFEGRVHLAIGEELLKPTSGWRYPLSDTSYFSWDKPRELKGRFGYFRDLIVTFKEPGGQQASYPIRLQITPGHLDDDELGMLLDDLVYLLFLDWKAPTTTDVWAAAQTGIDNPKLVTWYLIRESAEKLLSAVRQIAAHPHQNLRQVHYEARFNIGHRLDTESIRWLAQRGLSPDAHVVIDSNVLLPHDVPSTDTPENRFVLIVLRRVVRLLETLGPAIKGQIGEEEKNKAQAMARNRSGRSQQDMAEIENRIKELSDFQKERERLQRSFQRAVQLSFFQGLGLDEATFVPPTGSLVLTQEPSYFRVFDFYSKIQARAEVDWLSRAEGFTRQLTRIGTDRMSSVYESWAFVRIYHELGQTGFKPRDGRDLADMMLGDRLNPRLYSGDDRWIEVSRNVGDNGTIRLLLFHERRFWGKKPLPRSMEWAWKPDITIEIWQGKSKRVRIFLDAKYMDFHKCDKSFDGLKHLQRELYESAPGKHDGIEKYLHIEDAIASFILHPATHADFENYGAQVPRNQPNFSLTDVRPGNHRLGYIPFRPASPSAFRKFMGMLFVLKLGLDPYCWNCHSTNVQVGNEQNERYRYCRNCNTEWWLNHCGHCREHPVIIKGDEVPFQVKVSLGNYACPSCNWAFASPAERKGHL